MKDVVCGQVYRFVKNGECDSGFTFNQESGMWSWRSFRSDIPSLHSDDLLFVISCHETTESFLGIRLREVYANTHKGQCYFYIDTMENVYTRCSWRNSVYRIEEVEL